VGQAARPAEGQAGQVVSQPHLASHPPGPNHEVLDSRRDSPVINDYEEAPLNLEEVYCALLGRGEQGKG
jgi:hypothetical protein